MTFELREFQKEAVAQLRDAAIDWTLAVGHHGPPRAGRQRVPLLASLQAITGAGKTPILASVLGGLGPAIVFWTTKSSFLVDQTVTKLDTVYRPFLPEGTELLAETPSPSQWRALLDDETGTTIWVRTVASWNDTDIATKNTEEARLNLHRPAPDWTGDEVRSPWSILGDRSSRKRPLWVVYDEGHGQTSVQLDQLLELAPEGLFAATATPVPSAKFGQLQAAIKSDDVFGPIAARAVVQVPTIKVAQAQLLKTTVKLEDLDVESSGRIAVVAKALDELDKLARKEGGRLRPRAIYIVEKSDLRKGEKGDPPPVVIWNALREQCGVPANEIVIATDTKELPKDAIRIKDFAALRPKHRHIIFNKKLQEGWDDPEAYVAYFDGETQSALRITQLIGRVIRQPQGQHALAKRLNTAHLFLSAPNKKFEGIVEALRKSLIGAYGADSDGVPAIEVTTNLSPVIAPVVLRRGLPDCSLPIYDQVASGMDVVFKTLSEAGERKFPDAQLASPGIANIRTFDLTDEDARIAQSAREIGQNIRVTNRTFMIERVASISRQAKLALDARRVLSGPMWDQSASARASAQDEIAKLARAYVSEYEARVRYVAAIDPDVEAWRPKPYEPRLPKGRELIRFKRSVHVAYPNTKSVLGTEELEFARALDAVSDGWWARNFDRLSLNGYGVTLPVAVDGSNTFFPDFLWWVDGGCWAIDTTGKHLLEGKIRGKLFALTSPRFALVVKGRITADIKGYESRDGWSLVQPRAGAEPKPIHANDLAELLKQLRTG